MSYLESDKRFTWMPALSSRSLAPEAGCVQCGSRLEMNSKGKFDPSGRCPNCDNGISEEDEELDELGD